MLFHAHQPKRQTIIQRSSQRRKGPLAFHALPQIPPLPTDSLQNPSNSTDSVPEVLGRLIVAKAGAVAAGERHQDIHRRKSLRRKGVKFANNPPLKRWAWRQTRR